MKKSTLLAVCATVLLFFGSLEFGWGQVYLINETFNSSGAVGAGWTFNSIGVWNGQPCDGNYCMTFNASGDYGITPLLTKPGTLTFYKKRSSNTTAWEMKVQYSSSSSGPWTDKSTISAISGTCATESIDLSTLTDVYIKLVDTRASGTHERSIDLVQITTREPTIQTSAISFSNVLTTSMTVSWTIGNGTSRAVFMKEGTGAITDPVDGTTYSASANWNSKGTQLGSSGYYCIYNGTGTSVALTNLVAGTTYVVQAFEYFGSSASSNYYTATASNNPNSQATQASGTPIITVGSITGFGNVTVNTTSAEKNYNVSGSGLTADIVITPPANFEISLTSGSGFVANPNTITLTQSGGSVASTPIYVRFKPTAVTSYSDNITHTSTGATPQNVAVSGTGIAVADPTGVSATTVSASQINVAFTKNSNNNNVLIAWNSSNTFGTPTGSYSPGNSISGGGTVLYVGATSPYNHTGLTGGTPYYYKLWSVDALNFYSSGVTANATTFKAEPSNYETNLTSGTGTPGHSAVIVMWDDATGGTLPDGYLIKGSGTSFAAITAPSDGTAESDGTLVKNIPQGTGIYEFTGLAANTTFYFKVWPYTNSGTNINYKTDGTVPQTSTTTDPLPWIEDFETGTKGGYAAGDVTCTKGSWYMDEALIGTSASDHKNGLQSVRMRNAGGSVAMNFDKSSGAGVVTVYHAKYGSISSPDASSDWQLQMSIDGGANWTVIGSTITTTSLTLSSQNFTVNQSGNVRFRIYHVTGSSSARLNIDDVTLTDYYGTPSITSFTPDNVCSGSSASVTITGNNLANATSVKFNGTEAASYTVNSTTSITANTPAGVTTGKIAVTTPGGTVQSAGDFTVTQSVTPSVTIVASANPVTSGTSVAITATPVNGGTTPMYQFYVNAAAFGPQTSNPSFSFAPPAGSYDIYVVMTPDPNLPCFSPATATSNTINLVVTASPATSTWTGSGNDHNWHNTNNWNNGVPGSTTAVTIPSGLGTNYPTVSSSAICASITIESGASLINNGLLGITGQATVKREISDASDDNWHLFISPITQNIAATASSCFNGAYLDRYDEPSGEWVRLVTGDNVVPGYGYSINYLSGSRDLVFTGTLKNSPLTYSSLSYSSGAPGYGAGWHLIGNPYPCGINPSLCAAPSGMNAYAYVWDNAGSGNYLTPQFGSSTTIIAPLQGFFVRTTSATNSLTLANNAKTHGGTFYKNENAESEALVVKISGNNYSDQTIVRFNRDATTNFDQSYDAYKLWGLDAAPQLYSILPDENAAVNTLPAVDANPLVPLGLKVGAETSYTLTVEGMESFDSQIPLRLDDLKLGISKDLRTDPVYSFTAAPGDAENRFRLRFASAIGFDDPEASNILINSERNVIRINYMGSATGTIHLYNDAGQLLSAKSLNQGETTMSAEATGIYLVKVITGKSVVTKKVVVVR